MSVEVVDLRMGPRSREERRANEKSKIGEESEGKRKEVARVYIHIIPEHMMESDRLVEL